MTITSNILARILRAMGARDVGGSEVYATAGERCSCTRWIFYVGPFGIRWLHKHGTGFLAIDNADDLTPQGVAANWWLKTGQFIQQSKERD